MCTLSCRMSFLALVTAVSGLPCSSSTMNFTLAPPKSLFDLVEVHLEAVDHVLADLGEDAGGRREEADAQLLGGVQPRSGRARKPRPAAAG